MDGNDYRSNLKKLKKDILSLPTSDIKYDLYLLWLGLNKVESHYTKAILQETITFCKQFRGFYSLDLEVIDDISFSDELNKLKLSLEKLLRIAETNSLGSFIQHQASNLAGIFVGISTGICSGIIGGFAGFARGIWHSEEYGDYTVRGLFTGFCIGAAIGNRSPHLLTDPFYRQLKFAMDGLSPSFKKAFRTVNAIPKQYRQEALDWLLKDYFAGEETKLNEFLDSDHLQFEIVSRPAEFGSKTMRGYFGQHAMIKMNINGKYLLLEFTPSPSDPEQYDQEGNLLPETQSELRTVSADKLIEMLSYHCALQKTDSFSLRYALTTMQSGVTDCVSYVNKLLIGTGQEPQNFGRFHSSDNMIANYIIAPIMEGLSPNPPVLFLEEEVEDPYPYPDMPRF